MTEAKVCPRCKGAKKVVIAVKGVEKSYVCPSCRGSGKSGLVTK